MFLFALRRTNYKNAEKRFCFISDEARMIGQEKAASQQLLVDVSSAPSSKPTTGTSLSSAPPSEASYHLYHAGSELTECVSQGWQFVRTPDSLATTYLLPPSVLAPMMLPV
jgi:hypothetical protein